MHDGSRVTRKESETEIEFSCEANGHVKLFFNKSFEETNFVRKLFELRPSEHMDLPGEPMVFEVWDGDKFKGSIYPTETGIKIVSKYINGNKGSIIINPTTLEIQLSDLPYTG